MGVCCESYEWLVGMLRSMGVVRTGNQVAGRRRVLTPPFTGELRTCDCCSNLRHGDYGCVGLCCVATFLRLASGRGAVMAITRCACAYGWAYASWRLRSKCCYRRRRVNPLLRRHLDRRGNGSPHRHLLHFRFLTSFSFPSNPAYSTRLDIYSRPKRRRSSFKNEPKEKKKNSSSTGEG